MMRWLCLSCFSVNFTPQSVQLKPATSAHKSFFKSSKVFVGDGDESVQTAERWNLQTVSGEETVRTVPLFLQRVVDDNEVTESIMRVRREEIVGSAPEVVAVEEEEAENVEVIENVESTPEAVDENSVEYSDTFITPFIEQPHEVVDESIETVESVESIEQSIQSITQSIDPIEPSIEPTGSFDTLIDDSTPDHQILFFDSNLESESADSRVPQITLSPSLASSPPLIASRNRASTSSWDEVNSSGFSPIDSALLATRMFSPVPRMPTFMQYRRRIHLNRNELLRNTRSTHLQLIRSNQMSMKDRIVIVKGFFGDELKAFKERLAGCERDLIKFYRLMADLIYDEGLNEFWNYRLVLPINFEGMQTIIFELEKRQDQQETLLQICFEHALFVKNYRSDRLRKLQAQAKAFAANNAQSPKLIRLAFGLAGLR